MLNINFFFDLILRNRRRLTEFTVREIKLSLSTDSKADMNKEKNIELY